MGAVLLAASLGGAIVGCGEGTKEERCRDSAGVSESLEAHRHTCRQGIDRSLTDDECDQLWWMIRAACKTALGEEGTPGYLEESSTLIDPLPGEDVVDPIPDDGDVIDEGLDVLVDPVDDHIEDPVDPAVLPILAPDAMDSQGKSS